MSCKIPFASLWLSPIEFSFPSWVAVKLTRELGAGAGRGCCRYRSFCAGRRRCFRRGRKDLVEGLRIRIPFIGRAGGASLDGLRRRCGCLRCSRVRCGKRFGVCFEGGKFCRVCFVVAAWSAVSRVTRSWTDFNPALYWSCQFFISAFAKSVSVLFLPTRSASSSQGLS